MLANSIVLAGLRSVERYLTQDEVTRLGINLDPFTTSVGQPLEASLLEHVDLVGPSETAFFITKDFVVFGTKLVPSFQDEETAVFRAIRQEVNKALDAAKALTFWVL